MRQSKTLPRFFVVVLMMTSTVLIVFPGFPVYGDETGPSSPKSDIQHQIDAKNEEIKRLEAAADQYRSTLTDIGKQSSTLSGQINGLDKGIKKLSANILLTNAKIEKTKLEITKLGQGIQEKERSIAEERRRIGRLVSALALGERETPLEILMKNESISGFFTSLENLVVVQSGVKVLLENLRVERVALQNKKSAAESKELDLASLSSELADEKALEVDQRRERARLLAETKNQERQYQALLGDTQRKRDALEQEIKSLEASLNPNFDRSKVPAPGKGILGWPLPEPIFITQYFGLTDFALSGAYKGKGHNGIDFRAALGTPVFAAEEGTVRGTGDTDVACRRASYGRWILIDHSNGLTTVYGHLSLIKVSPGDAVNRGELIGYSGNSGYATGPHLHVSVFAASAVEISRFKSKVCGRMMTVPISPFGGYLNPIDYL